MDNSLLLLPGSFGLGALIGRRSALPLACIGLLTAIGYVSLTSPFDHLASPTAIAGLLAVFLVDALATRFHRFRLGRDTLLVPVTLAAGAIVAASQTGVVTMVHPGLAIVVGVLAGNVTADALRVAYGDKTPEREGLQPQGTRRRLAQHGERTR
jgi:hypothetical protein